MRSPVCTERRREVVSGAHCVIEAFRDAEFERRILGQNDTVLTSLRRAKGVFDSSHGSSVIGSHRTARVSACCTDQIGDRRGRGRDGLGSDCTGYDRPQPAAMPCGHPIGALVYPCHDEQSQIAGKQVINVHGETCRGIPRHVAKQAAAFATSCEHRVCAFPPAEIQFSRHPIVPGLAARTQGTGYGWMTP